MQNNTNPGLTSQQLQSIIDQIVKTLKVQSDRRRDNVTRGNRIVNPQNLVSNNPTTYGPFYFGTTYASRPDISFGQIRVPNQAAGIFLVEPYVDSWASTSGGVVGFTLGVYAITPIPPGLYQHIVSWVAVGKASLYKANNTNEKWNSGYNLNEATNLSIGDGSMEKNF